MANMTFGANLLPKTSAGYSLGSTDLKWNIYGTLYGDADTVDSCHESAFYRHDRLTATNTDQSDGLWGTTGSRSFHSALPDGLSGIYGYGQLISFSTDDNARFQIYASHSGSIDSSLWYRTGWGDDKKTWRKFIDSGNISSQTVSNSDMVDGYHLSDLDGRYVNVTGDTMSGRLTINGTDGGPYLTVNYGSRYDSDSTLDNNGINLIKFGKSSMDNYLGTCLNTSYTFTGKQTYVFHTGSSYGFTWFTSGWTKLMELESSTGNLYIKGSEYLYNLFYQTSNGITTTFGAQNGDWVHIYNNANKPFIFNNTVATTTGDLGTTAYPFKTAYLTDGIRTGTRVYSYGSGVEINSDGGIEIYHTSTPFIDFHYAASTSDYSVRLICQSSDSLTCTGKLYGAVWNDYAEYRETKKEIKPGYCVIENGDDTLSLSTKRLQRGAEIVSDTFGFAIGETDECKTPIAATGRVLAYTYEDREIYRQHIGYPVCSGPEGKVSIMTEEEEEEKYPSRIIGFVSAVPDYKEWGTGNVKVNGRVWIRIR